MKKKLDIIGVYSGADCYEKGTVNHDGEKHSNLHPVLYKQLASAIEQNEYDIEHIYLFNSFSDVEEFYSYYKIIIDSLISNYPNYDFTKLKKITCVDSIEEALNIDYGVILYTKENDLTKQITISFYQDFFNVVSLKSKSDTLYYNLQSGNVHSKEAIQISFAFGSNKEILIYNESILNEGHNKHENEYNNFLFFKDSDIIKDYLDTNDVTSRISLKSNLIDISSEFHAQMLKNFLSNNLYFEAYYHYLNYRRLYDDGLKIFDDYLNSYLKIKYIIVNNKPQISKAMLALYYLKRLFYIYISIKEDNVSKLTYKATDELLYTIFHLENGSYVEKLDDKFIIYNKILPNGTRTHYEDYIDRIYVDFYNNLDNEKILNKTSINEIDFKTLHNFLNYYVYFRHPENYRCNILFSKNNTIDVLCKIFEELKNKFEKEYLCYLDDIYKGNNFEESFNKNIDLIISKIKINKKTLNKLFIEPKLDNNEKVCILSMAGSTDPGKINPKVKNKLEPGSTLSLMYSINDKGLKDNETLIKIRDRNKQEPIPFYFILTKEIIDAFFKPSNKDKEIFSLNDLNSIYHTNINILPFAKNSNNSEIDIDDIIKNNRKYSENDLLNMISYSIEGYSIKLCLDYISKIIGSLLEKYDYIYLIESSGIPNCKIAFSFLYLLYPGRISVLQVKNPNSPSKQKPFDASDCLIDNNCTIPEPLSGEECILSKIKKEDRNFAKMQSYLIQELAFDENEDFFKNEKLKDMYTTIMNHDNKEIIEGGNEEIARTFVKFNFLMEYGFEKEAYYLLDKPLETIFCTKYKNKNNITKDISFDKYVDIKKKFDKFYTDYDKNINSRSNGFVNMVNYAFNYSNNNELKDYIMDIYNSWETVSDLKHASEDKMNLNINRNIINKIISFDDDIKKMCDLEMKYYKEIQNKFLNLKQF